MCMFHVNEGWLCITSAKESLVVVPKTHCRSDPLKTDFRFSNPVSANYTPECRSTRVAMSTTRFRTQCMRHVQLEMAGHMTELPTSAAANVGTDISGGTGTS